MGGMNGCCRDHVILSRIMREGEIGMDEKRLLARGVMDGLHGPISDMPAVGRLESHSFVELHPALRILEGPAAVTGPRVAAVIDSRTELVLGGAAAAVQPASCLIAALRRLPIVVPFATIPGGIACPLECSGHRGQVRLDTSGWIVLQGLKNLTASKDLRAAGMADRITRVSLKETRASLDQAIERRGTNG